MPKPGRYVETRTREYLPHDETLRKRLDEQLANRASMQIEAYVRVAFEEALDVVVTRRAPGQSGGFGPWRTIKAGLIAPDEIETHLYEQCGGPGYYQLFTVVEGHRAYASQIYPIGAELDRPSATSAPAGPAPNPIDEVKRKVADAIELKTLKDLAHEDNGFKAKDMIEFMSSAITAIKATAAPQDTTLLTMLQQQNQLLMTALIDRQKPATGAAIPDWLLKLVERLGPKSLRDVVGFLRARETPEGPEPEASWVKDLVVAIPSVMQALPPILAGFKGAMPPMGPAPAIAPPVNGQPALPAPKGGAEPMPAPNPMQRIMEEILTILREEYAKPKDDRQWSNLEEFLGSLQTGAQMVEEVDGKPVIVGETLLHRVTAIGRMQDRSARVAISQFGIGDDLWPATLDFFRYLRTQEEAPEADG